MMMLDHLILVYIYPSSCNTYTMQAHPFPKEQLTYTNIYLYFMSFLEKMLVDLTLCMLSYFEEISMCCFSNHTRILS